MITKHKKLSAFSSYLLSIILLCAFLFPASKTHAEGVSANLSLVTSRSDLYPGKAFTVTLYINPNMKVDLTTFNTEIQYDETKIEVVKTGNEPKIVPSSKVPKEFTMSPSSSAGIVSIAGFTMKNKIVVSGNTPLLTMYFKVKESADSGIKANFSITKYTSFTINISGNEPEKISLNFPPAKVVSIGPVQSRVATLESLSPSEGTLSPKFSSDTLNYTLDVPDSVNSVKFTAKPKSSAASFKITGGTSLDYGVNTVTIKVTAQDKDFSKTYSVKVNRANIPTVTPEEPSPTEEIHSSIESISQELTPTPTSKAAISIIPEEPLDSGPWKTIAIIFIALFVLSLGVVVWLSIDKVKNRDRMIKVKRI